MAEEFYTQNGWSGKNYVCGQSTKEIAKLARDCVKKEFPECKFSITKESYAGGSSIYVTLVESTKDVLNREVTKDETYYQLNHHCLDESTILNEYGRKVMEDVNQFINSFRYSDSDGMIDYFCTNFYSHFSIGDWDKPYKVVEAKPIKEKLPAGIVEVNGIEIVDYSEKSFAVYGNTKPIKDN